MTLGRRAAATLVLLSATRTVGAEPCAPRAALDGDAAAVASVSAELQRLGVTIDRGDSPPAVRDTRCRTIVAAVELDRGGGISVAVRDGAQRSEGRVVSDAAVAAAWIDSWLHDGFEAPPAPAQPLDAPPGLVAPAAIPEAVTYDRLAVAASYDQMWTEDGTRWSGFSAAGCVHLGAMCVGARVRYASGLATTTTTAAARSDTVVLATASWSQPIGRMFIAPEVGLGVGRMTTDRVDGCAPPPIMCNPMTDPTCNPNMPPPMCTSQAPTAMYFGDGFSAATITPRASAALRFAVPLFDHVWLDAMASVMLAPLGHSGVYASHPIMDPMTMGVSDPSAIPGEPAASVQVGIGLRIGGQ